MLPLRLLCGVKICMHVVSDFLALLIRWGSFAPCASLGGLLRFGTSEFGAYGICFVRGVDLVGVGEESGLVGRVSG